MDLDGDVDNTDKTTAQDQLQGRLLAWDVLTGIGNRKGHFGGEHSLKACLHRHRFLLSHLGRWNGRDVLGPIDGNNLYEFAITNPLSYVDPSGLTVCLTGSGADQNYLLCMIDCLLYYSPNIFGTLWNELLQSTQKHSITIDPVPQEPGYATFGTTGCGRSQGVYTGSASMTIHDDPKLLEESGATIAHEAFHAYECLYSTGLPVGSPVAPWITGEPEPQPAEDFANQVFQETGASSWAALEDDCDCARYRPKGFIPRGAATPGCCGGGDEGGPSTTSSPVNNPPKGPITPGGNGGDPGGNGSGPSTTLPPGALTGEE